MSFDIFILVAEKYVHYIRTSDPFDPDRIERLRSKGVKKLYIPEHAEQAYLGYLDRGLGELQNQSISVQDRSALVSSAITTEAENVIHNVQTAQGYHHTESRIEKVVNFLTSESGALKTILGTTGAALDNFQHATNVTSLAIGLANHLGVTNPRDLLDLGLAGLLHDAALTRLGFRSDVDPKTLTGEDLKRYEEHPTAVAYDLADKPYVNKSVLDLIANHEEMGDGAGYPNRKRISTLPLTSQILNLCNAFDKFWSKSDMSMADASKLFFKQKIGLFELSHMQSLSQVIQAK